MEVVVLDAGPLIYLAKLDALDVLPAAGHVGALTPSVWSEVAQPALAFRFPEIASIQRARDVRWLEVYPLAPAEIAFADDLAGRLSGLHRGELDCLAVASARGWPVCLHERQASRMARTLGMQPVHLVELLFRGMDDRGRLEACVRGFARLTNLAVADLDDLLHMIVER